MHTTRYSQTFTRRHSSFNHKKLLTAKYSRAMSPPEPVKDPSTNLPSSPVLPPRIHHCHWDWCRLTFSTDALLIDHVICEHVRTAQPVRRRDLPMLRRAEEGLGDSLSSGMDGILSSSELSKLTFEFHLYSLFMRPPTDELCIFVDTF